MTQPFPARSRRTFLAVAAAMSASAGAARAQTAPGPTVVRVASAPDEDILATLWAMQNGIFAKHGLDVKLQAANSGAAVASAVVGGAVDIGKSSMFSLINAHLRGVPLECVAAAAINSPSKPTAEIIVAKSSSIQTGSDLNGATIGVHSLNDLFSVGIDAWVDHHGGDASSLKYIELPGSADVQAIVQGRIAAAAMTNPSLAKALAGGEVRAIGDPFTAIAARFIQAAYFAKTDYINANRQTVEGFGQAIAEASSYVNAHPAETAPVLAKYTKVPLNLIEHMNRTELTADLDPALIQPLIDTGYKYKAIAKAFPAKEIIAPFALANR